MAAGADEDPLRMTERGLATLNQLEERGPYDPFDPDANCNEYGECDGAEARVVLRVRLLARRAFFLNLGDRTVEAVNLLLDAIAAAGLPLPADDLPLSVVQQEAVMAMYIHRPGCVLPEPPGEEGTHALSGELFDALNRLVQFYSTHVLDSQRCRWSLAQAYNLAQRLSRAAPTLPLPRYALLLTMFVLRHHSPTFTRLVDEALAREPPNPDNDHAGLWMAVVYANHGEVERMESMLARVKPRANVSLLDASNTTMCYTVRLVYLFSTGNFVQGLQLSHQFRTWAVAAGYERGIRWSDGQIARFSVLMGDKETTREMLPTIAGFSKFYREAKARARFCRGGDGHR